MLTHIGITINNKQDITKFYKDILGMEEITDFSISQKISQQMFGIEEENPIVLLKNENLVLELFFCEQQSKPVYNHFAIDVPEREKFVQKVEKSGYPVHIYSRVEKHDLVFIEDSSGNKIEVGEKSQ